MRFTKMHGAGNDYVYVNLFEETLPRPAEQLAPLVSDRHTGIGGDGIILICPSERADARMRMYNADGSESEMCGNGVRCVAKFVYDHGIAHRPEITIETGRGVLTLQIFPGKDDRAERIRVNMGEPILDGPAIPTTWPAGPVVEVPLPDWAGFEGDWTAACGLDRHLSCVSMGNPHVMLFCRDVAAVPLERIGPLLEHAPQFPRRINVHFVQVHSRDEITMRTWERGSGITLACGTGACACAVATQLIGRGSARILAHLPGGDLELEWSPGQPVFMTGPATEVFTGDWPFPG